MKALDAVKPHSYFQFIHHQKDFQCQNSFQCPIDAAFFQIDSMPGSDWS